METKRLLDIKLVKYLMKVRKIRMITITNDIVLCEVSNKMTPLEGETLCNEVGHPDARPKTSEGRNFIAFRRHG